MALRQTGQGMVPTPPNPDASILEPHVEGGSRSPVLTTDWQLHVGQEPGHIDRIKRMDLYGYTGPRQVNDESQADAQRSFLGHVPLLHRVKGVTPGPGVTIDDKTFIPAIMAGNPSESAS